MSGEAMPAVWQAEAAFFDTQAARHAARGDGRGPLDPLTVARYARPRLRRRFSPEERLRVLGGLRGKRVVDVGCGEGTQTVLMAKLGAAHVTGVDLSPGAIALARALAAASGVQERVSFVCAPVETAPLPERAFDVVWCNAILHHLTHQLDEVLSRMVRWARPEGIVTFTEPVALSPLMTRLRRLVPLQGSRATPDERPLGPSDLGVIRRYVDHLQLRYYSLFSRLDQFVLTDMNYERSTLPRRLFANVTAAADALVLSAPGLWRLSSVAVMWGRPRQNP